MSNDFNDEVKKAMEQEIEKKKKVQASEDTKRKGRDLKIKLDKKDEK